MISINLIQQSSYSIISSCWSIQFNSMFLHSGEMLFLVDFFLRLHGLSIFIYTWTRWEECWKCWVKSVIDVQSYQELLHKEHRYNITYVYQIQSLVNFYVVNVTLFITRVHVSFKPQEDALGVCVSLATSNTDADTCADVDGIHTLTLFSVCVCVSVCASYARSCLSELNVDSTLLAKVF